MSKKPKADTRDDMLEICRWFQSRAVWESMNELWAERQHWLGIPSDDCQRDAAMILEVWFVEWAKVERLRTWCDANAPEVLPLLPLPDTTTFDPQDEAERFVRVQAAIRGLATDAKTDTPKKTRKKTRRPLSAVAAACALEFRKARRRDNTLKLKQFVEEYAAERGLSADSIYRTLTDNPDAWKDE